MHLKMRTHTCTHVHIHTCMQAYIATYTNTYIHTYIHACCMHACIDMTWSVLLYRATISGPLVRTVLEFFRKHLLVDLTAALGNDSETLSGTSGHQTL